MTTATHAVTADPRGTKSANPAGVLLGYALAENTAQAAGFAFKGTPVNVLSLRALDIQTHPPRVQAEILLTPWAFETQGSGAISTGPGDMATWVVPIEAVVALYATPTVTVSPAPPAP